MHPKFPNKTAPRPFGTREVSSGRARQGRVAAGVLAVAALTACQLFEYSPHVVPHTGLGSNPETHHNLHRLAQPTAPGTPFRFAVIADIQRRYGELAESVRHINADTTLRFVLAAGDLAQAVLDREFAWVDRELNRLHVPWMTVIGNHDALGNGPEVYRIRYGPLNYTFDYGRARFIVVNTNGWEFPGRNIPDFTWMERELARARADSMRIFVFSHVGPYVHQLDSVQSTMFIRLMVDHGVELSMHGHMHSHRLGHLYDSTLVSVLIDNIGSRNYSVLTVGDTGTLHTRVFF